MKCICEGVGVGTGVCLCMCNIYGMCGVFVAMYLSVIFVM